MVVTTGRLIHAAYTGIPMVVSEVIARGGTAESVSERVYNCASAAECIEEGMSVDPELRIFETGWSGGKPICFVRHPIFLVLDSAALCRKWAQIPLSIKD